MFVGIIREFLGALAGALGHSACSVGCLCYLDISVEWTAEMDGCPRCRFDACLCGGLRGAAHTCHVGYILLDRGGQGVQAPFNPFDLEHLLAPVGPEGVRRIEVRCV